MTYLFFALILLFTLSVSGFLWVNDFSNDTIDFLFPAAGAVLASFFLAYKTVWIDAPPDDISKITIGVMHDSATGQIYSMYRPKVSDSNYDSRDFRGYHEIETVLLRNSFKELKLEEQLKNSSDNNSASERAIFDLVEFSILNWLSMHLDLKIGYEGTYSQMVSGSGGGGSWSQTLESASIDVTDRNNELISAAEYSPHLPKGGKVTFLKSPGSFVLSTPHSRISFEISGGSWESFSQSVTPLSKIIKQRYGLPIDKDTPNFGIHGIQYNITFSQIPYKRMSEQSKLEKRWLDRLKERIYTEFYFENLRKFYLSNA
jgi:hypothetical protein